MVSRTTTPGTLDSTSFATHTQVNDVPFGLIAYTTVTNNTGSFTTEATLTGFDTGSVTTLSNRYYRIYFELAVQSTAGDSIRLFLTDGSHTHLASCDIWALSAGINYQIGRSFIHAPGAGSRNYLVRGQRLTSNGTCIGACDDPLPGYITVEDVGQSSTGWA